MALRGNAALAMWWHMAPAAYAEFAHWHAHEHFPERLSLPGFMRASRWRCAAGGEGVFVLYELQDPAVLASHAYLARLNSPTPWSTRMMPLHRGMVRSQCQVLESWGALSAERLLTIRLSPEPGREAELREALRLVGQAWMGAQGGVGLHVLKHAPPPMAQTQEQRIRGLADQAADWVLLVCAYDAEALEALSASCLSPEALQQMGAQPQAVRSTFVLAYAALPEDVACLSAERA